MTKKPKPAPAPYRAAIVRWHDAHDNRTAGWVTGVDVDRSGYIVTTCGFVYALDDHLLTVCMDVGGDGMVNGVSHIPRGMVVSIDFLT